MSNAVSSDRLLLCVRVSTAVIYLLVDTNVLKN